MPLEISQIFAEQRAQVYRWALALCRRHDDALDVVQDVFVRALENRPSLATIGEARAWLRRVTANVVIDRWRRTRRIGELSAADGIGSAAPDALADAEQGQRVRAALAELSERQRLVLMAKCFDNLTFAQTAQELGISVSTVKTYYLRGLDAVRDWLALNQTIGSTL